jgi:hypothetical protein
MDTLVGFLVLIGIGAALWWGNVAIDKGVSAVDRTLRSKTYTVGIDEVAAVRLLAAPIAPSVLLDQIVSAVNAHPSAPALVGGLYLKGRTARTACFGYGSKAHGDAFDALVKVWPIDTGSAGSYHVENWAESGADVLGRKEMVRLRSRIEEAVHAANGSVEAPPP